MSLADAVVASWSLTQEVTSSSPFTVMTNIFSTELNQHLGKTQMQRKSDDFIVTALDFTT